MTYLPPREGHQTRAREVLNRLYGVPATGAEIGVFVADMSVELLRERDDLTLFMVDPWRAASPYSDYAATADYHATMSQQDMDDCAEMTRRTVQPYGSRARILRMTSLDAVEHVENGALDFVFLDADHSYVSCVADIAAWRPKIKPGGWLCGHDYGNKTFPIMGVKRAVDEFVHDHVPAWSRFELGDDMTWFVRLG